MKAIKFQSLTRLPHLFHHSAAAVAMWVRLVSIAHASSTSFPQHVLFQRYRKIRVSIAHASSTSFPRAAPVLENREKQCFNRSRVFHIFSTYPGRASDTRYLAFQSLTRLPHLFHDPASPAGLANAVKFQSLTRLPHLFHIARHRRC